MMQFQTRTKGFTLIEIIVVITIIFILTGIVLISASDFRERSRDDERISDLKQYELAIVLFAQQYGRLPDCPDGLRFDQGNVDELGNTDICADQSLLENFLTNYFGTLPSDPLGPGNSDYYYYYVSTHFDCPNDNLGFDSQNYLLFAANVEDQSLSNVTEACGAGSDALNDTDGGFGNTTVTEVGGTMNPSYPYIINLNEYAQ